MIARLQGQVIEVSPESAIIDVAGVGYEVTCSLNTLFDWQAGQSVVVFTYTHVREDILQLFGFSTTREKEMFTTLLKVNGIGPKMAINILSGANVDQILLMVESEDVKGLSKLPKVGKKTAEQRVLALKGKLVLAETTNTKNKTTAGLFSARTPAQQQLSSALVNLGFRPADVDKVISDMPKDIDLQEGLRQGLGALSSL